MELATLTQTTWRTISESTVATSESMDAMDAADRQTRKIFLPIRRIQARTTPDMTPIDIIKAVAITALFILGFALIEAFRSGPSDAEVRGPAEMVR